VSQKLDTAFKDQEEFLRVMLEFPEIMQKVGYTIMKNSARHAMKTLKQLTSKNLPTKGMPVLCTAGGYHFT